jgi:hypothetical protein
MSRTGTKVRAMAMLALLMLGASATQAADARQAGATLYWDATWAQYQLIDALPLLQAGLVQETRELAIDINAPRETVYDIYSNVYNALGRHSYLREIIAIRCGANHFDFTAVEDVPYSGVVLPLRTVSRQVFHRPDFYTADTYDRPMTITHQTISFTALSPTTTRVVESLTFESSPLLISTAVSGGVEAHTAVQQSLKAAIEAGELVPPLPFPDNLPIACSSAAP